MATLLSIQVTKSLESAAEKIHNFDSLKMYLNKWDQIHLVKKADAQGN